MKKFILIIAISTLTFISTNAQTLENNNVKSPSTQLRFPDKCIGTWSGTMQIYMQGMLKDSVKVVLTVSALSNESWGWKTEYISEKLPMTKDYALKTNNNAPTIFVLDEGDGVELLFYNFGNKLYSFFETEGIFLSSTYELTGEQLIFEVTSGKKLDNTHTQVTNYSVDVLQRIVMNKNK
jgi:hypothetical protein